MAEVDKGIDHIVFMKVWKGQTDAEDLHLIEDGEGLRSGQWAAATQSLQHSVKRQQVGLHLLLSHLLQ